MVPSNRTTTQRMTLLVALLSMLITPSLGFSGRYTFGSTTTLPRIPSASPPTPQGSLASPSKLLAFRHDPDSVTKLTSPWATGTMALPFALASAAPLFHSTTAAAADTVATFSAATSTAASAASLVPPDNAMFQAEVLTDMAHLTLDLATLFGPAKLVIRAAAVVGRMAAMGADYLPDHFMLPEELVFQVFMLGIAWTALVQSAMPVILSSMANNITVKDGKAFSVLFEPAGMTWPQYKALSVTALDWVTVPAGQMITSQEGLAVSEDATQDDYVYWLYQGNALVSSEGIVLQNVTRNKNGPVNAGTGWLGETRLLSTIQEKDRRRNGKSKSSKAASTTPNKHNKESASKKRTTFTAGEQGATLLRIHTSNLTKLMEHNVELAQAVRSLLFQGMQDKLAAAQFGG